MTPLHPEPTGALAARWWRSVSLIASVLLIAGAGWRAARDSTDHINQESRQRSLITCGLQAQSRVEGNSRYYVLRDFILAAAQAREDSAAATSDPTERRIDLHAAANYRALLTRIHPLPIPDCSRLIP